MNTKHTLKELADIGAFSAMSHITGTYAMAVNTRSSAWERERPAREAFTKAVLDAVGYEFPKDEEREAFAEWLKYNPCWDKRDNEVAFFAWKAGREELRKELCSDKCEDAKTEPEWIPWEGGGCPIPGKKKYEVRFRHGGSMQYDDDQAYIFRWSHNGKPGDILAYRVWE